MLGSNHLPWEAEIDSIERYNEILIVVHLLESANNPRFASNRPGEIFVGNRILEAHALLSNSRQLVFVYCGEVFSVKSEVAGNEC